MDEKVLIFMSTYNGKYRIEKQVESIINQNDVDIHILIRDDGSQLETVDLLKKIEKKYPTKVDIKYCENIGWKRSFINLLFMAPGDYDFYGFSDQDDIWFPNKIINCIKAIEESETIVDKPILAHCAAVTVDESLQKCKEQEKRVKEPESHKMAITTEYFQGCAMLWNSNAMKLITRYKPNNKNLAHDYWVGLLCYLFGTVCYVSEPQFYHIRYSNSTSSDGDYKAGRVNRLKDLMSSGDAYMVPADDLLNGYKALMKDEDIETLSKIINYKHSAKDKLKLIFDSEFRRPSKSSTMILKLAILTNRY